MIKKNILLVFAFVFAAVSLGSVLAQSANFVNYQQEADFQTTYTSTNANLYWPQMEDSSSCTARQDILLQVSPGGCQPAVVRSDLLADQNVPVFCQVDALYVNPLVDIKQIRNIRFGGSYPSEVAGTGFEPARAALKGRDMLLGNPLVNNIGYVVVVLKKNPVEKDLPDFIEVNLTAQLEYEAGNAMGIGRTEFLIDQKRAEEAGGELERMKNSFWNGRYSLVLEDVDSNMAEVSVYDGDKKISTVEVKKGETSREIYMPGTYCNVALQIVYDGLIASRDRAKIEIVNDAGTDAIEVYEGSSFLNDKCTVGKITATDTSDFDGGSVVVNCGGKSYTLGLNPLLKVGTRVAERQNREVVIGTVESIGGAEVIVRLLDGSTKSYTYGSLKPEVIPDGVLANSGDEAAFNEIITAYEKVADDFRGEMTNSLGISTFTQYGTYGEAALVSAMNLAYNLGKYQTAERLLLKLVDKYPDSKSISVYEGKLSKLYEFDLSASGLSFYANGRQNIIRLTSLKVPSKQASAIFTSDSDPTERTLELGKSDTLGELTGAALVTLHSVEPDSVRISDKCTDNSNSYTLKVGESVLLCDKRLLSLSDVNLESAAKLRVLPKTMGSGSETNLTVKIGIEKRAIQLSPDQTKDRIKSLNKSIEKFEQISAKLDKVVEGLSGACLATSFALTIKSFISGASGESLARQQTMEVWKTKCRSMVPSPYKTITECYSKNSGQINSEIANRTSAIQNVNKGIAENVENQPNVSSGNLIFGKSVDQINARDKYLEYLKKKYPADAYIQGLQKNLDGTASYTYQDLRDLDYNLELQRSGLTSVGESGVRTTQDNIKKQEETLASALKQQGDVKAIPAIVGLAATAAAKQEQAKGDVVPITASSASGVANIGGKEVTLPNGVVANSAMYITGARDEGGTLVTRSFIVFGNQVNDQLNPAAIYEYSSSYSGGKQITLGASDYGVDKFKKDYSVSEFIDVAGGLKRGVMAQEQRKVSYFESGPDKGLASLVPFRPSEGWYVRIDSSLDIGKNIAAYDTNGLPKNWWICNVGTNGVIDKVDSCYLYQANRPMSDVKEILGVTGTAATTLLENSRDAIMSANNQRSVPAGQTVNILGTVMQKGAATSVFSGTDCQDFMGVQECNLLFNVCDPVVCPPSRCNLGGKYQVDNVIEQGIIGSLFLCLPNFGKPSEGGVVVPICLTGVKSGVDSWTSMLKDYRDCLQVNLDTGQMVGICDQIHSIYLCDLMGKQLSPVLNQLVPTLVEAAYTGGQGAKGGVEYLTVQTAWNNAKSTMDYIAQSYATDTAKAFQIKSIGEIGTEFCKMYISGKSPNELKSLIEPNSPPQFHAWLSSSKYSSASVPATYQYKVLYHIFAGNSAGVNFEVYMKSAVRSEMWAVASGYADQGQYKSETKDFTAPEGYDEVCIRINNDEHCGFGMVSTSYALNTLSGNYASEQMTVQDIKSTTTCVSGSESTSALLTNTNPQAAVEGAAFPDISNRGIIRICSSTNPGASTEPARYRDVGYCDSANVRCWLDIKSVENAIGDNNAGLVDATMSELNADFNLQSSGGLLADVAGAAEVKNLSELAAKLKAGDSTGANSLIGWIDLTYDKFVMNNHKAALLLIKAMVLEKKWNIQPPAGSPGAAAAAVFPDKFSFACGSVAGYTCSAVKLSGSGTSSVGEYSISISKDIASNVATGSYVISVSSSGVAESLWEYNAATKSKGAVISWQSSAGQGMKSEFEGAFAKAAAAAKSAAAGGATAGAMGTIAEGSLQLDYENAGFSGPYRPSSEILYVWEKTAGTTWTRTDIYVQDSKVWLDKPFFSFSLGLDEVVGSISSNKITLLTDSDVKQALSKYYDSLNGATISGKNIIETSGVAGTGYSDAVIVTVKGYSSIDYRFDRTAKVWQYNSLNIGWYDVNNMKAEPGALVYADEYMKIAAALAGRNETWGKNYFVIYAKGTADSGTIVSVPSGWTKSGTTTVASSSP